MNKIFILLLVLLSSCAGHRVKVVNDRYYDGGGWFSVDVPKTPFSQTIDEEKSDFLHAVRFLNEFGELTKIEVLKFPAIHAFSEDADFLEINFIAYLETISENFPGITVLYQEKIQEDFGKAYFAMINIPKASTLALNGKVGDSLRGYLFSVLGENIVIISYQYSPLFYNIMNLPKKEDETEFFKGKILPELLKVRNSIRLENNELAAR